MIHPYDSVIVFALGRVLIPVMQLFGLYVLFFGQYGPGGGFVGGVILGTSVILSILVFGLSESSAPGARAPALDSCVRRNDGGGSLMPLASLRSWIPAFAGMMEGGVMSLAPPWPWIPAFAGMTEGVGLMPLAPPWPWIPAFAGMTERGA